MAMKEKLKQVVEDLKKKAEEWNEEYDDTMIEDMTIDVIEIFEKNGFEKVRSRVTLRKRYVESSIGFEEICEEVYKTSHILRDSVLDSPAYTISTGIIEYLKEHNYILFEEIEGFYIEDAFYIKYQIYYNNRGVVIVVRERIYTSKDYELKFYDLVGVFTPKE